MGERQMGPSNLESTSSQGPTFADEKAKHEQEFIEATPSAELLPLSAGVQDDEADSEMGKSSTSRM
jgi:hypothetical protein